LLGKRDCFFLAVRSASTLAALVSVYGVLTGTPATEVAQGLVSFIVDSQANPLKYFPTVSVDVSKYLPVAAASKFLSGLDYQYRLMKADITGKSDSSIPQLQRHIIRSGSNNMRLMNADQEAQAVVSLAAASVAGVAAKGGWAWLGSKAYGALKYGIDNFAVPLFLGSD